MSNADNTSAVLQNRVPRPSATSLKMGANEKGMSWCLERLKKELASGRKTKTLSIFQAVPLYYAALAVKREEKMTMQRRNAEMVEAYKFATGAFLEYLRETHEFNLPSWLTMNVMGCTTLSSQGQRWIQMLLHCVPIQQLQEQQVALVRTDTR